MTVTLTEALETKTEAEILEETLDALSDEGVDANGFGTYSVERALPTIHAVARATEQSVRANIVRGGALDTAAALDDPAWLRRLAKSLHRIDYIAATKAIHRCRLTNGTVSGGPFDFTPRGLRARTLGNVFFQSTEGGRLAAGFGATLDLFFEAEIAGVSGNVANATINKLVTSYPGVSISNIELIDAGRDDESNAQLVARCDGKWGTVGKGNNANAYRYNAIAAAPTVTRVFIRDDNPFGPGTSAVYLANASGPATPTEVETVAADFADRKTLGNPTPEVFASPEHTVEVVATLYLDGSNTSAATDAIAALEYLASIFTGEVLYAELVRTVLMGSRLDAIGLPGFLGVKNVTMSAPAADVTISPGEVLVFDPTLTVI